MRDEKCEYRRGEEGVCCETVECRAVAAVEDVCCCDCGCSGEWWEDGEEEACFFVWEDGVEDYVGDIGDEEVEGGGVSAGLSEGVRDQNEGEWAEEQAW